MKTYIAILTLALGIISCKAQTTVNINTYNQGDNSNKYFKDIDNLFDNFIGTWEGNIDSNTTFRMVFWKAEMENYTSVDENCYVDVIKGKFYIIKSLGTPNETIICQSEKYYPQNDATWWSIFHGGANSNKLGGAIWDNCTSDTIGPQTGELSLTIINPNSNPITAHWVITRKGLVISGHDFRIPTDIIMTKVN